MSLCTSIDTLSMAYLDDELAAEERRELELHLLECPACRQHVDGERAELADLRKALVTPPAPDLVKVRIAHMLDAEDQVANRAQRRRLSQWALPGSAIAAAAAAMAVFVAVQPGTASVSTVAREAVRQQTRALPLEVQGASTGTWVREHFATVALPQFSESVQMLGARLTAVNGHDAAQLLYQADLGSGPINLSAVVVRDLRPDELSGGQEVQVGRLILHMIEIDGTPAVTYVDDNHTGYVFMSEQLGARELVRLVVNTDLIERAEQIR